MLETFADITFATKGIAGKSQPIQWRQEALQQWLDKYIFVQVPREPHGEIGDYKIFKSNIFAIDKVLPKFMKILYLKNL